MLQRYNQKSPRKVLDTRELFALAEGEDPLAREIVKSAGEAVGVTLGFLVNVLDPEAVIIGGGIGSHSKGVFWESLVASTRHHIWADNARDLPIIPAALGPDSGLIGAAVMVAQRFAPNVLPATSQPIHR
jgi:glucokinase